MVIGFARLDERLEYLQRTRDFQTKRAACSPSVLDVQAVRHGLRRSRDLAARYRRHIALSRIFLDNVNTFARPC